MLENRIKRIGNTHASFQQQVHANSGDKCVFIKHGDIQDEKFKIKLDFIRDLNNGLGLLSEQ